MSTSKGQPDKGTRRQGAHLHSDKDRRRYDPKGAPEPTPPIHHAKYAIRNPALPDVDYDALLEPVRFSFAVDRRSFVQLLGAGVLVTAVGVPALGQRRGNGRGGSFHGGPPPALSARIHFGDDGTITILSGKVDAGQGSRGQIAQAAAEELRVPLETIKVVLADTSVTPNDGSTAGSRTTPATVPVVRQAAAAVRELLAEQAAQQWNIQPTELHIGEGRIAHNASNRSLTYIEIANDASLAEKFAQQTPSDIELTPVSEWRVLGTAPPAVTARDKVLGRHEFPSDIKRPGMLYGRVLRPPKYRAKLESVDLAPAEEMERVAAVQDGEFVGVAAPTAFAAEQAVEAIAKTAKWSEEPMPSSNELYDHLRKHAEPPRPHPFEGEVAKQPKKLAATYTVAYVQHAPLEPRTAVAEWRDETSSRADEPQLTVWTATQNPFGVRGELANAFQLPEEAVRVIVPDFGSAYGGKHTGECAVEAARIAKAAGKPVMLRWTRAEEFTWAYFRPAAVIDIEASLDAENKLATWFHTNINSGGSSIDSPYNIRHKASQYLNSQPPLRHGAYRALASTANSFARESFMDELAALVGMDPLEFRLAHLEDRRLRAVLEEAAKRFNWSERVKQKQPNGGVGLACSLDKGSYVACCAEVEVDRSKGELRVVHVCEAFDCGPAMNPNNLRNQIEGAVIQGLGPALREEMRFEDGAIKNASFMRYRVPHFKDVPTIDVHVIERNNVEPAGAGETPIIAIAPAIGNAVFHATGQRIRSMPLKLEKA